MAQVQCPNCGGYRVEATTSTFERKTGVNTDFGCSALAISLLFAAGFVVGGYCAFTLGIFASGSPTFLDVVVGIVGVGFGLLIAIYTFKLYIKNTRADKITRFYNTCSLCGYKWTQRSDEPLLPVHVRRDLITEGELRLAEEERQRNLEAGHWNYWHNPDNPWNNPDNTSN